MTSETSSASIVYDVRPARPGAHLFEVVCQVSSPDADGHSFSLPAWIPGSYLVRDYARHVVTITAEAGGDAVSLQKVDKSTWRTGPIPGAAETPLIIRATIYANDLSVRGAYLAHDHAFVNGVCLFFRVEGRDTQPCVVHLAPPDSRSTWTVATGLKRLTGAEGEFGAFAADNYDELIDRPALMGELTLAQFTLEGAEHVLAIAGRHDADIARLERDIEQVCRQHAGLFGGSVPFERYVFLLTVLNMGYGGLEHSNSSALICKRGDLPRVGDDSVSENYRKFLGLVSHEYFHLWNVKRIKPAEFVPYPLDREAYTRQLWIFEGITSYYDDLGVFRAGLINAEDYLELLGCTLTRVYRARGRRHQTLEDASFDAWIKFYRQNENSPNALVSYYSKGAMVALALDLELRLQSEGRCSLDDVMLAFWQRFGGPDSRGLPEGGFETFVEEVSGLNLEEFFNQSLRTTIDPPVGILLAKFGVRLGMRAADSDTDVGGKPSANQGPALPWLGFRTRSVGECLFVKYTASNGRAAQAGLAADDELVSLDGLRISPTSWPELLQRCNIDEPVEVTVFRRDELMRFMIEPEKAPRDTCYLTLDDETDAAVSRRLEWLGV